jgi:trans-aconitate methyltransferase
MAANRWDSSLYDTRHGFVSQFGEDMITLLAPQPGERIFDLGCGTGHLAHKIATAGASVVGMDSSPQMIEQARHNYPELTFKVGSGEDFKFDEPFDAVFSNAALHWMKDAGAVVGCIAGALKPGGRFVAELGGKTNIQHIYSALVAAIEAAGQQPPGELPWYFPSIGEYASLLERHGFVVHYAALFERPTPLEGEEGLRNWLRMFADHIMQTVPAEAYEAIIPDTEQRLRPVLYQDGGWMADYVRLRVIATWKGAK